MKFLRVAHDNHNNGAFRPLSPEAFAFWLEHGAVIANLLRPETPLPLPAIVQAYAEYQLEHPEAGVRVDVDDAYLCRLGAAQAGGLWPGDGRPACRGRTASAPPPFSIAAVIQCHVCTIRNACNPIGVPS